MGDWERQSNEEGDFEFGGSGMVGLSSVLFTATWIPAHRRSRIAWTDSNEPTFLAGSILPRQVMDEIEEQIQRLHEKYPIVPHTYAGRLSSTVRRMKAEREQGIPTNRRTGFAVSVETGESASEMNEVAWESFYSGLCDALKRRYPSLHESVFSD